VGSIHFLKPDCKYRTQPGVVLLRLCSELGLRPLSCHLSISGNVHAWFSGQVWF